MAKKKSEIKDEVLSTEQVEKIIIPFDDEIVEEKKEKKVNKQKLETHPKFHKFLEGK